MITAIHVALCIGMVAASAIAADRPAGDTDRPATVSSAVQATTSSGTLPAGVVLPDADALAKMDQTEMRNLLSGLGIGTD